MRRHWQRRAAAVLVGLVGAVTLCGCGNRSDSTPSGGTVVLFGAASTTNALNEIKTQFEKEHGGKVETNYASSSTLAHQIENGAGAQLFLSANEKWADHLEKQGLIAQRKDLLGNHLVVIVPADSDLTLASPEDLKNEKITRLALADPSAVPAGIYARQALEKLGLWESLSGKVVAGDDVRRALFYVESGNAQAGIVYATDAAISESVKVAIEIDPDLTEPIRYPLVLLKDAADDADAKALYDYLGGPQAAEVFRKFGFTVLGAIGEKE